METLRKCMLILLSIGFRCEIGVTGRSVGMLTGGLGNGVVSRSDVKVISDEIGATIEPEPADDPWTVTLSVSLEQIIDFDGIIEILILFENETRNSALLPFNRYQAGRQYTFPIDLEFENGPKMVYLRIRGSCDQDRPPRSLRLNRLTLYSKRTGTSFVSDANDLHLTEVCNRKDQNHEMQVKDDFSKTFHLGKSGQKFSNVEIADLDTTDECDLEGITYANGQTFEQGCRKRCTCIKGSVTCLDRCPVSTSTINGRNCRNVHIPGRCCDEIRCEEQIEDVRAIICQSPVRSGSLKGELVNGLRSIQGDTRRYPWAVLICTNDDCRKNSIGGVIVGERHILILAPNLENEKRLRIASGSYIIDFSSNSPNRVDIRNIHEHSDFVNSNQSRLQLVELEEPFVFGPDLQAVNLPLSTRQCSKLSSIECPVSAISWESDSPVETAVRIFLRARISSLDPRACALGQFWKDGRFLSLHKRSNIEKKMCLTRSGDCPGTIGSAVIATSIDDTDYLIGLVDPVCTDRTVQSVLPICLYVDWINEIMNS